MNQEVSSVDLSREHGPQREKSVPSSVKRLQDLASQLDDLVQQVQSAFAPVIISGREDPQDKTPRETKECCEVANVLDDIADRFVLNIKLLKSMVEAADV